ncbi:hypothetical protein [Streptomyces odonnellii]|uniref:hypothetical protein n=1 Tax=Streptomyces odonnellii TaxID=1417980 RepID=UPI00062624EC|nr:hypothetical protein [Streptomyces odonnellii]
MDRIHLTQLAPVLGATADRLATTSPSAAMSPAALHMGIQLSVWDRHGAYNTAAVGRDITRALAATAELPLVGTCAQYAVRLRSYLQPNTHG